MKIKRILAILLTLVMLIGIMPTAAFAAEGIISSTTTNSNAADGVSLKKTSVYDPSTGKMEITLEAFTTGTVVSSTQTVPTDIVLVLDVSGSMNATRMESMKTAVNNFIDSTKIQNDSVSNNADKHSIAIIKFADDSFYSSNNPLAVGDHKNGSGYNHTEVIAGFTPVNTDGAASLKNAVTALTSGGATAVDYGLDLAERLFDVRTADENYAERNKVVIVFADGEPNHSNNYDDEVAYNAVHYAYDLKAEGVKLFTIGIFEGADSSDTDTDANKFMNYLSSNYPLAYGSTTTEYSWTYPWVYTAYHINPGEEPHYNTYYHGADTTSLNSVFQTISGTVGHPQITLGSSAALLDVVSDYFTIEGINGSNPQISVSTSAYKGGADFTAAANWDTPVPAAEPIDYELSAEKDTVYVTGFDYDSNYVSATPRDGSNYGKKLILKISATPNYAAIDAASAAGIITNGRIPTNDTAALLDSHLDEAAWTAAPTLQANTVTYKVAGSTVATYYRFPGAEVTVNATPTNTATYTYSDWATTDATISNGKFTMPVPAKDVVLTSTATVNKYDVTFVYLNSAGIPVDTVADADPENPSTKNETDVAVGSTVSLPHVTPPAGYTFSGWSVYGSDVSIEGNQITMPARDVTLYGTFIPHTGVKYTVNHHFEKIGSTDKNNKDNYELKEDKTQIFYGTTGETVTAEPLSGPDILGFSYEPPTFSTASGVVTVNGQDEGTLVLNLYYSRTRHSVTYQYRGTEPVGGFPALPAKQENVKFGTNVGVEPAAEATGYTFSGWNTDDATVNGSSFSMPANDVIFYGEFSPAANKYVVKHYMMDTTGHYPDTADHTITYDSVKTGDTVTATVSEHTGFTYDEAKTIAVGDGSQPAGVYIVEVGGVKVPRSTVAANGTTVLNLYYKRNQYTVSYEYYGDTIPTGVTPACDSNKKITASGYGGTYYFGEEVPIAPDATDGHSGQNYTFSGWYIHTGDTEIEGGTMKMPNSDVVLRGSFTATGNTPYIVEHYFETLDGTYEINNGLTQTNLKGAAGKPATAVPLSGHNIAGFTFNAEKSKDTRTGIIPDAGTLTLKLYYDRTAHDVKYQYTGNVPDGATTLPGTTSHKYGKTVTRAGNSTAPGYTFSGWTASVNLTIDEAGDFTMPASEVIFTGHFDPTPNKYTVKHYLMDTSGNYPASASHSYEITNVVTDQPISASTNVAHTGFVYDDAETRIHLADGITIDTAGQYPILKGTVAADGSTVLELYFQRLKYSVTYQYDGDIADGDEVNPVYTITDSIIPIKLVTVTDSTKAYIGEFYYEQEVPIMPEATYPGYLFTGWSIYTGDTAIIGGKMKMPDHAVVLHGAFNADPNTPYIVEHYFEKLVDNDSVYTTTPSAEPAKYTLDDTKTQHLSGETGASVTAVPLSGADIRGFSYNKGLEGSGGFGKSYGIITAVDGEGNAPLTLQLYYSRVRSNVKYEYTGDVPTDAPDAPAPAVYAFGVSVELAGEPNLAGYTFSGWSTDDAAVGSDDKFSMPEHEVTFQGSFTARNDVKYTVEYYLQDLNDENAYTKTTDSFEATGTTGAYVAAPRVDYPGFTFNITESAWNGHVKGDGSLVLKLYYDRNVHTVTYHYYGTPPAGVEITLPATRTYKYGENFAVEPFLYNTDNDTYSFRGWFTSNLSSTAARDEIAAGRTFPMPDHDVIFFGALYNYTVIYDLNGGTLNGNNSIEHKTVGWDYADLLPAGTPSKSGMRFTGWTYESTPVTAADKYSDLAANFNVVSITLVAQYESSGGGGGGGGTTTPKTGTAKLFKVDATDSSTVLADVIFELHKKSGALVGTYTTNAKGEISVPSLATGDYYWVEVLPAEGYSIDSTQHSFTISSNKTTTITVTNSRTPVPEVFTGDHFGYIIGYEDGMVHPEKNISRAEVATIFFRLLTEDVRNANSTRENSFSDVNEGHWFNHAVSTMSKMGIINGYEDGTFRPNAPITRAEFAAIAARFDLDGDASDTIFKDIYEHWGRREINIAANNGWVLGYEDGTFKPNSLVTRAEAMAMVNRVLQRIPESSDDLLPGMVTWPDNQNTGKWYYMAVQEATNSHFYDRKDSGYEKWTGLRDNFNWEELEK